MPFLLIHIIDLLRHIEAAPSKPRYANATNAEIQQVIRSYIADWFDAYRSDIDDNPKTLLAILSTLLPQLRPDRVYGYREGGLGKVLVRALWLENSHRRTILETWRTSTLQGDLATAVEAVMKLCETNPDGGKVSVEELNMLLDMLAARSNFSSEELRKNKRDLLGREPCELLRIYNRLSSVEAKWVTRMILKNLSPVVMPGTQRSLLLYCGRQC
jgi:DNA ligase-4